MPRLPAAGDASVVKELRSGLFSEPILAAVSVQPKGYTKAALLRLLGWALLAGPLIAKRATEPLPPTILYIAVTPVDIRMFSKPTLSDAFEIGRWKKGSYRASVRDSGVRLKLDLELERIGRATVQSGRRARETFDLVVAGASGPVM